MNPDNPSDPTPWSGEMEEIHSTRKLPSLSSLFHVLWLRKWTALTAWLLLAIPAGVLLSIFDIPKSYTATTVLRFPEVVGAQTNVMRDVAITQGQSIIAIFNSYQVLESVVRKMALRLRIAEDNVFHRDLFTKVQYTDNLGLGQYTLVFKPGRQATVLYRPNDSNADLVAFQGSIAGNAIIFPGLELQLKPHPEKAVGYDRPVNLRFVSLEVAVAGLQKAVATRPLGASNFEFKLKDRDPWLVADILNTLREQFLEVYYGTTEVQDVGILVQMEKDLELAKAKLEKSQNDLSRYFTDHPELNLPEHTGDNMAYLQTRQEIELMTQRRKRVMDAMGAKEADASPEKLYFWATELLSAMSEAGEPKANIMRGSLMELNSRQMSHRATLGPNHPKILEVETEKAALYRQIEETQADLVLRMKRDIDDLKVRMAGVMPRNAARPAVKVTLELERLQNVNANSEAIYNRLLESYNRAKLVTGSEFFKVTVVDQARPALYQPPSVQTRLLIALAAVILLLILVPGAFLAWPLIVVRLHTRDDVRRLLGLRNLGVVIDKPEVGRPKAKKAGPRDGEDPSAKACDPLLLFYGTGYRLEDLEAYRIIREEAENAFRNPADPDRLCLMVTSCNPNEGKSTCAANLAMTFARKGKRTLLVDADFRLGRVAQIFNIEVGTGLDEVLDNPELTAQQFLSVASHVFQNTMQRNLVVAPRKAPNANAGEMASSDRFKAFIRMAREQFDVVVIDTPPAMITPEPLSLAELAQGVVFVCRSGFTLVSEARDAVETLRERGVPVAAILNRVRDTPFQQNRYRKYSYYYQVQPKPGDPVA